MGLGRPCRPEIWRYPRAPFSTPKEKGLGFTALVLRGADVRGYIQQIQDLPATSKVKQVVLCFYANDMPPRVIFMTHCNR